jgi:hypothetical protein
MKLATLVVAVAAVLTGPRQEVDNPEFKTWSGAKKGAWVKYKMVSEAAGSKTEMEQTTKLLELSDAKATIETAMTVAGTALPGQKRDVPAKVKTQGDAKGDAPKPKEGDEEIEVGGKKLKCHWVETTVESGGNKTVSKVWHSKDIPGGMAKMESSTTGAVTSKTVMTAVEWKNE